MIWLISVATFFVGALLAYALASKRAEQQAQTLIREQTSELVAKNEALDAEAKQARQDLADLRYKLSQTEKDLRYLQSKN